MGSEYISRKILDAYFDRFTLKIIRIHERNPLFSPGLGASRAEGGMPPS